LNDQDIRDRTFEFACRVVRLCEELRGRRPRAGESTRDFISKCCIGLKELREAHGRLRIQEACKIGSPAETTALRQEANELVSIVWTLVRNTRANAGLTNKSGSKGRSFTKVIANS
jgi:hypothetical protein